MTRGKSVCAEHYVAHGIKIPLLLLLWSFIVFVLVIYYPDTYTEQRFIGTLNK